MGQVFDRIYERVRRVPYGKVATYGQIARLCGFPGKAQMVGWALHQNPKPGEIPCHRVVNRFGGLAGCFAFGGVDAQRTLLEAEGVAFQSDGTVDLARFLWRGAAAGDALENMK
jgi:methylated-DNA-protein-cysteine methyltransferase-like protein